MKLTILYDFTFSFLSVFGLYSVFSAKYSFGVSVNLRLKSKINFLILFTSGFSLIGGAWGGGGNDRLPTFGEKFKKYFLCSRRH